MEPEEEITATLEFLRIADMCGVTGMESRMAERIKAILIANPDRTHSSDADSNTHCLTSGHITSASHLPTEHPVRGLFAAADVRGFLLRDDHKFFNESQEIPKFSVDLLNAVQRTLKSPRTEHGCVVVNDPLDGKNLYM